MIHSRFFRIMAAAVVLALIMLAIPLTPVLGAPTVTLLTTSGQVGDSVTISGSELTNGETYTATFAYGTGFAQTVASGTVSGTTLSVPFSVPAVPRGTYTVQVVLSTSETFTPTYDVIPVIIADATANVGDTIDVDGDGFAYPATINIKYDGVAVTTSPATVTTNTSGSFTATFTLPASVEGSHTIYAEEVGSTSNNDTVSITVSPDIALNPASGSVGDTFYVSGDGFDGPSTVTITFDGLNPITANTDASGTLPSTAFVVPAASKGSHTVRAQDTGGNYDTATYTVAASITTNPTSGPSGTTVTVTGTGFAATSTITITYDGDAVTTDPSPLVSLASGNFSATFVVPTSDAGTYVVSVSDGSTTITANFESTTSATISETTTEEEPGHVGMSLTITGTGFSPETTVTVKYATDPVTIATAESSPTGAFSVTFTIPPSVAGEHTITVSDGDISREFEFWMEDNPPPTPELTTPAEGAKLEDSLFEWEEVEDAEESDPVTYDLQVATSSTFSTSSIVIDETGLEEGEYTIPEAEELESRGEDEPYYWRVRALDAASNASDWSEEMTFTVGWSFEFSGWVVWVTMVVVAAAFFFFGLWIGRRGGGGADYF